MPDNPAAPVVENPETLPVTPAPVAFAWKAQLPADFANSPTMQKFPDTKDGFTEAVKSHLLLEKLLGYEKVPIPKGKDDTAAMAIWRKALAIPEKPEGYALPEVEIPESMKGLAFDKKAFQEVVHKHDLTPAAAKGIWEAYTEMTKQTYAKALKDQQDKVTGLVNQLKGEWGDAYASKVELGQMVINKFSENQEMNDFITAALVSNPLGVKFLAKLGDQFAENKIGDFRYQRHSLTPEEAKAEWDSIRMDPNHPYNNEKAPQDLRNTAIQRVNELILATQRPKG